VIKCPKCSATLPDGAGYCQFCQATFLPTQPVRSVEERELEIAPQPQWVWPAYYAVAGWWIADGLINIIYELVKSSASGPSPLSLLMNGVSALIGLGLLLKVELVRKIINVFCFINIVFGILGLIPIIFSRMTTGIFGLFVLLTQVIGIASSVLMIYLLGETDTQTPNY
jgi:hypothetical protein